MNEPDVSQTPDPDGPGAVGGDTETAVFTPRSIRRIGRSGSASCAAVAIGLSFSYHCLAKPSAPLPVELTYEAPNRCGSEREVLNKLRRALGDTTPAEAETTARVKVTARGDRYVVEYSARTNGVRSSRTLNVDSCEAATEAAALLLLLTLDPVLADTIGAAKVVDAAEAEPEQPAKPEPSSGQNADAEEEDDDDERSATGEPSPATPEAANSTPQRAQAPASTDVDVAQPTENALAAAMGDTWFGLGAQTVTGVTPRLGIGAGLVGGAEFGWLSTELGVLWARALDATVPSIDGSRVVARLWEAHIDAGAQLGTRTFGYGPRVGLGAVMLQAETGGVTETGAGSSQWLVVRGGAHISTAITGAWTLTAGGDVLWSLRRPRFLIAGADQVVAHRPATFGSELFLGISYRWSSQSGRAAASTKR